MAAVLTATVATGLLAGCSTGNGGMVRRALRRLESRK